MQTLRILALLTMSLTAAEAATIKLGPVSGAVMVTVASSEPPATPTSNEVKPEWVLKGTANSVGPANSIWYSLINRMEEIRIGGFGDQYEVFLKFPTPELPFKKATLRLYASAKDAREMPKSIEVRRVTTPDPLPIAKKPGASWSPERIQYAMRPSSTFFTSVPAKKGWVEIDITAIVQGWVKDRNTNHGLHFCATDHRDNWVIFGGPSSKEHPPELVLK